MKFKDIGGEGLMVLSDVTDRANCAAEMTRRRSWEDREAKTWGEQRVEQEGKKRAGRGGGKKSDEKRGV